MKMHDMTSVVVVAEPSPTLEVRVWEDPVLEQHGHDPRSAYVEAFWLPLLGPSATLLGRQLARRLERSPDGFAVEVDDAARSLGLGAKGGRRSPFNRTVGRLAQFRLVHLDDGVVLARRRYPGLSRTQVSKLPPPLREAHDAYRAAELSTPAVPAMREQARTLALTLLQVGETPAEVEAHLRKLRFHPALAHQSTAWAMAQRAATHATGVLQSDGSDGQEHTSAGHGR
jgi:hypothetical protein